MTDEIVEVIARGMGTKSGRPWDALDPISEARAIESNRARVHKILSALTAAGYEIVKTSDVERATKSVNEAADTMAATAERLGQADRLAQEARRALMDIEAVWLAAWIKRLGADATLDHSDQTELNRIRQRLWEATEGAAKHEVARTGTADALAEAAGEVYEAFDAYGSGNDEPATEEFSRLCSAVLKMETALSAHRSEGGPRAEVIAFADAMEERLRANDHKGGWRDCELGWLSQRLLEEWRELDGALWPEETRDPVEVIHEAADVANFAMMIADVCGALTSPAPRGDQS